MECVLRPREKIHTLEVLIFPTSVLHSKHSFTAVVLESFAKVCMEKYTVYCTHTKPKISVRHPRVYRTYSYERVEAVYQCTECGI